MLWLLRVNRLLKTWSGPGGSKLSGSAFFFAAMMILPGPHPARAQHWQRLGPPGGIVVSLAAAPDGTAYLGTPDGHVFASADRGEHWELRGRAGDRLDGVVVRIVPDPMAASRLLAALWFRGSAGGGVFESTDKGRSWKLAGLGDQAVRALEQSPSDPKVWVAGTRTGVFRSVDDTRSWQRITRADDAELQNVDSLAVDPRDSQTIYVGTYHLPWKTTDGGATWNAINAGMIDDSDVMSLHIDAREPQRIFSSACSGIYRSEDGGASWTKLEGIPYASRRTQQLVEDPEQPRTLYAATTEGLWKTTDYGESWKRITPRDTDATSVILLGGKGGQRILAGMTRQGVLRSDDQGSSFAPANEGFSHRVITAAAADTGDAPRVLVRAEGSGGQLLETSDGGRTWLELAATLPPKPVERIFSAGGWWAAYAGGGLGRFDEKNRAWRPVAFREVIAPGRKQRSSQRASGRLRTPEVRSVREEGARTIAATSDGLWELPRRGGEFRRAAARNLPASVYALETPFAIAGGELWRQDANSAWRAVATPHEAGRLLWVEPGPFGRDQLLIGTERGVYQGGGDDMWRLVASGLPAVASLPPACSGTECLAAMGNGGLYRSSDRMKTWTRVDSEAERSRVVAIFPAVDGSFLVLSVEEGMLAWTPGAPGP